MFLSPSREKEARGQRTCAQESLPQAPDPALPLSFSTLQTLHPLPHLLHGNFQPTCPAHPLRPPHSPTPYSQPTTPLHCRQQARPCEEATHDYSQRSHPGIHPHSYYCQQTSGSHAFRQHWHRENRKEASNLRTSILLRLLLRLSPPFALPLPMQRIGCSERSLVESTAARCGGGNAGCTACV